MPLLLRTVDPAHVARGTLPQRFPVQNDLEAVSNGTLSNVIRQLSALSHHAEELFADLIGVASGIAGRASNLQARIDRLAVRVGQIDSVQEESPSIHESLNTKPFTSSLIFDQQVVSRGSLPPSMLKTFQLCDMPPPLDKLNKYRDDGRNGLKFYTDPSYFFDLWRQEMLKDTERAIDRGKKPHKLKHDGQNRHKKRVRQPHNTRERQRHLALQHGETIMGSASPSFQNQPNSMESNDGGTLAYQTHPDTRTSYAVGNSRGSSLEMEDGSQREHNRTMSSMQQQQLQRQQQYEAYQRYYASPNQNYESPNSRNNRNTPVNGYRPSQPPPAPPPNYAMAVGMGTPQNGTPPMHTPPSSNVSRMSASRSNHRETLPPPPPPPTDSNMFPHPEEDDLPPPPPTPLEHGMLRPPNLPEDHLPPSPPPPPLDDTPIHHAPPPPPPPPPGIPQLAQNGDAGLMASKNSAPKGRKVVLREDDGRDELLKAIRDGINLRKVETNGTKVEEKPSTYHDVASILARRVAVEMSDSDSGSSEYDSDGWDEASA